MEKNAGTFVGPHMLVMFVKGTRIHEGPRGGELSQFLLVCCWNYDVCWLILHETRQVRAEKQAR